MREPEPSDTFRIWPIPIPLIEEIVSGRLGPGRVRGNLPESCFSRQVSMYLAKHVGGWSTTKIGKFYNGRHHTTVLHAIRKIESCRKRDPSVDALLEILGAALLDAHAVEVFAHSIPTWPETIVEAVAARVIERLTCFPGPADARGSSKNAASVLQDTPRSPDARRDQRLLLRCLPGAPRDRLDRDAASSPDIAHLFD